MRDISTTIAMIMAIVIFIIKVAFMLVWVWAVISLIDVSMHNLITNYVYSEWNLFEILFHVNH